MLAEKAKARKWVWGDILLWASLGPIFASCSPTYAILLSVVFPKSFLQWVLYTLVYSLGFALLLWVFVYGGRAIIKKFSRAVNPYWRFKKLLGFLLIITWFLIVTGYMKDLQTAFLNDQKYGLWKVEEKLLEKLDTSSSGTSMENTENSMMKPTWESNMSDKKTSHPGAALLNANYLAPEIAGLENWINGWNYTSLKELKGKVVLVDFWTYSCINCIRTLGALKKWHELYADKGLVIIWIHAPEFQFEKKIQNVQMAVQEYGLKYPVVQDNNFTTWRNYKNRYWPAKYIIDKDWYVRYTHFGEWEYEETQQVIEYLLWESNWNMEDTTMQSDMWKQRSYNPRQTPETYLWKARATNNFIGVGMPEYINERGVSAGWEQNDEYIVLKNPAWSLFIKVYASEVNLVVWSPWWSAKAAVYVDDIYYKDIDLGVETLVQLWKWENYGAHKIEIRFTQPWSQAYAFTFG